MSFCTAKINQNFFRCIAAEEVSGKASINGSTAFIESMVKGNHNLPSLRLARV